MKRWLVPLLVAGCATGSAVRREADFADAAPDALALQLEAVSASLVAGGYAPAVLRERGFLPPGGRAAYPVHIDPGRCALFVAVGTANLADLDAALFTPEGRVLVEDDGTSARPSLTLCAAARPVDGYLTLHAYQGAGSFMVAQLERAIGPDDDLRTADEGPTSALRELAAVLHERGFDDSGPRVRLAVADAHPVRLALKVEAGMCYALAAEGEGPLAELALRLLDARSGELANGLADGDLATLHYCASEPGELALEVAAEGRGSVRVARFRAPEALVGGTRALWLGEPQPTPEAWRVELSDSATRAAKQPVASRELPLEQGQAVELAFTEVPACVRWQARLEPGLFRATLRVESDQGALLGEVDTDDMEACLEICHLSGRQRVSLVGRAGFGRVRLSGRPAQLGAEGTRCSVSSGRR